MKRLIFPIVLFSILILAEIGSYFAIRTFFLDQKSQLKWFNWIWFGSTVLIYAFVFGSRMMQSNFAKNLLVNIFFLILIAKLVVALTFFITSIIQLIKGLFVAKSAVSGVATDLEQAGKFQLPNLS
jgi:hypothetical protein